MQFSQAQIEYALMSGQINMPINKLLAKKQNAADNNASNWQQNLIESQQSVLNSISEWLFSMHQNDDAVQRVRQQWGFTDEDNVQIFVVPSNFRIPPMSFVTRPTSSPRSNELTRTISRRMSEISDLERGIDPSLNDSDRSRQISSLENTIRETRRELNAEKARLRRAPRSGFVVAVSDS